MTDPLHPTDGARFLLELETTDDDGASYRAAIYTPTERFGYTARLSRAGTSELACHSDPAPADLERKLATIAKVTARDANQRAADGLETWPHRILRWRGPK